MPTSGIELRSSSVFSLFMRICRRATCKMKFSTSKDVDNFMDNENIGTLERQGI